MKYLHLNYSYFSQLCKDNGSAESKPKNFLSFLVRLPPDPPPQGGKERKKIFGFAARAERAPRGAVELE